MRSWVCCPTGLLWQKLTVYEMVWEQSVVSKKYYISRLFCLGVDSRRLRCLQTAQHLFSIRCCLTGHWPLEQHFVSVVLYLKTNSIAMFFRCSAFRYFFVIGCVSICVMVLYLISFLSTVSGKFLQVCIVLVQRN